VEHNKITPIQLQSIRPQSPTPSTSTALLMEAIARRLAEAKTENHLHVHQTPAQSQEHQNAIALLQALAGLAIIFCLTFGTLSTIILIWRGAQATTTDYQTHTIK
jgi:hypothetical protein